MAARIDSNNADAGCLTGIGVFHDLNALGCSGAISTGWSITSKPVGSATVIAAPTALNTSFNPDIAGEYEIELCCNYETENSVDIDLPPIDNSFTLPCPHGAIAGEEIFIPIFNCNGSVVWNVTGAIISAQGNTTGVNIQLDPLTPGTVNVEVTCTSVDQDNNQTVTPLNCSFETYDIEGLTQKKSPTVKITAALCGPYCDCVKRTFTVKAVEVDALCEYSEITITVRDCTQPTPEVCDD